MSERVSADAIRDLLDRYYDDEWETFAEDGWRFVRDLRRLIGDSA